MRSPLLAGALGLSLVAAALAACTPNPDRLAAKCDVGAGPACDKARAKLQHVCELGHADACHALAELYAAGRGGPKDPAKAREYFDAACERGRAQSCQRAAGPAPQRVVRVVLAAAPAAEAPPQDAAPAPEKPAAEVAAPPPPTEPAAEPKPAPKPVKRASGPSQATLQARCEQSDEAACMALGRQMIQAEARKNPGAARELLQQMRQACADGDTEACDLIKKGLRNR
jgi:TPR repeat protein